MTTTAQGSTAAQGSTTLGTATVPRLTAGVVGGLAGGMVFGMLMQMMGMITAVAQLVGSTSEAVGWLLHLAISAFLGGLFAAAAGRWLPRAGTAVAAGAGYGMVWWVLGALLAMPAKLGMPVFHLDAMAGKSLMGHLIFGMVLGGVATLLVRRTASR